MKKVFLDTNICLDILLNREPFAEDVERIFEIALKQKKELFISSVSCTTIFYILKRQQGSSSAITKLARFRRLVSITDVNATVIDLALHSDFTDFEDAVQYFSAKESELDLIITRNEKDFEGASIKVLTPKQFLFPENK